MESRIGIDVPASPSCGDVLLDKIASLRNQRDAALAENGKMLKRLAAMHKLLDEALDQRPTTKSET